jgi:Coenzyme PQQ synthesis protein D (PqqD)
MISRNPSIIWTELDGNVVLFSIELAHYYETNAVGGLIWQALDEPREVTDLVDRVAAHYRVDREQCRADVLTFLDALGKSGLLAGEEAAPGTAELARSSSG